MKNNHILLLLFFVFQISYSQNKEKQIRGKILANQASVENIEIINLSNNKQAKSDTTGAFYILAKTNDILVFSHFNFNYLRKTVLQQDYESGAFEVTMVPLVTELEEVEVEGGEASENFGFAKKKEYTPAERRLATGATPVRLIQGLGISNDAIINAITGKTKRMKKELAIEKEEAYIERIEEIFEKEYFIESLKIDPMDVKGFKLFIVKNGGFIKALEANDRLDMESIMIKMAPEYKQILADEK